MRRLFLMLILFCLFPSAVSWTQEDDSATLKVQVEGIQKDQGEIGVAVFSGKKGFPTKMERSFEAAWIPLNETQKAVTHIFEGLPAGDYAVSIFHDENGDRLLDRTTLGYPLEGVGFSNDCRVEILAPGFKKCKFSLSANEKKSLVIKMEYRK